MTNVIIYLNFNMKIESVNLENNYEKLLDKFSSDTWSELCSNVMGITVSFNFNFFFFRDIFRF